MNTQSQPTNSEQIHKPISKAETDKLAQSWCELLLGQIQEARSRQSLVRANEANTGENIYREKKRDSALSRHESLFASSGCPLT